MFSQSFQAAQDLVKFLNDRGVAKADIKAVFFDEANGKYDLAANVAPFALSYSNMDAVLTKDAVMTPILPRSAGSPITLYAVAGVLPAGVNFDVNTGIFSGTPTALKVRTQHTVTMTNVKGSATVDVYLTVVA